MDRRHMLTLTALGGLAFLAGCGGGAPGGGTMRGTSGVLDVARQNDGGAFLRAVQTAGLTDQLSGDGPYTLFVPNDAAFRASRLPSDRDALRRVVAYHVVPGMVNSSFMTGLDMNHLTSTGDTISVNGTGAGIRVNTANVVRADLGARNGVVHVIDRVLIPA
jgi:uncharacterized surface protein with fasciclin (FAS1) repeats